MKNKKLYRWFYNHIGSYYYNLMIKWCFLPFGGEKRVRREIIREVALRPDESVLDMCCGTGGVTFSAAEELEAASRIMGIDLSLGQVRIAKKHNPYPNVFFAVTDATNSCFREGTFNKVLISHAIHEMPRQLRLEALREAERLLATGGTVFVLEMDAPPNPLLRLFIGFWWFYWLPFNFETPTRRDMLKHGLALEVQEAGFSGISKSSLFNGVIQVVQGKKQEFSTAS